MNPQDDTNTDDNAYLLPTNKVKAALQPLSDDDKAGSASADEYDNDSTDADLAADVIRQKIRNLYGEEPDAKKELQEAEAAGPQRSKHQQYMHELSASGKSQGEIQKAWHEYYTNLPDAEKHEVWQEFYSGQETVKKPHPAPVKAASTPQPQAQPQTLDSMQSLRFTPQPMAPAQPAADPRSVADIKKQITERVSKRTREESKVKQHLHSLTFGLATGSIVLVLMLFGFFNERFIAPFITPSRNVSATPIIIDPNSTAVGPESKVIIPKINVEIPVVYDINSTEENDIQAALEKGVVHYATTPKPGELGNNVIVGHSSNNILNKGKYKFAFVLLKKLEIGDTFYLTKDGKRYAYKVYEKKVVKPTDVDVMGPTSKAATTTLITCDPPGTSINRLVVVGEQISPDPSGNVAGKAPQQASAQSKKVPGDSPSLWRRLTGWLTS